MGIVKVAYQWLVEAGEAGEMCFAGNHPIKKGERVLILYFKAGYMALCAQHGMRLGLRDETQPQVTFVPFRQGVKR